MADRPPHGPMPGDCDCALCLRQVTDTRQQIRNLLQYLHELREHHEAAEAGLPGPPPTPPVVVRAAPAAAPCAHPRLVAPDGAGVSRSRSGAAAGAPAASTAPAAPPAEDAPDGRGSGGRSLRQRPLSSRRAWTREKLMSPSAAGLRQELHEGASWGRGGGGGGGRSIQS